MLHNRGLFVINLKLFAEKFTAIQSFMMNSEMVIYTAEIHGDDIIYCGISPIFRTVEVGSEIPWYSIDIVDNGIITATEVKR